MKDRCILHIDMNNFFATVECRGREDLIGKPVAVGGDSEARHGIILAKNYKLGLLLSHQKIILSVFVIFFH